VTADRAVTAHDAHHRRPDKATERQLDERIEGLSADITSLMEKDAARERLMMVPGIGPIILSAMVTAIGSGEGVLRGPRFFAAWPPAGREGREILIFAAGLATETNTFAPFPTGVRSLLKCVL
jgi:hypothetical protein